MKLLLKLILNRFMLSLLIIFFFAVDYKLVTFTPLRLYSLSQPTTQATEYYEVEFGAASIYINIHYDEGTIHLVPTSVTPTPSMENKPIVVAWYYYVGALAVANIIPFHWFRKKKKVKRKEQK